MTPIWMIPGGKSKDQDRDERLREYLRMEYGSPEGAWLRVESKTPNGKHNDGRFGARIWSALTAAFTNGKRNV